MEVHNFEGGYVWYHIHMLPAFWLLYNVLHKGKNLFKHFLKKIKINK